MIKKTITDTFVWCQIVPFDPNRIILTSEKERDVNTVICSPIVKHSGLPFIQVNRFADLEIRNHERRNR